jgi:hypothetical protein
VFLPACTYGGTLCLFFLGGKHVYKYLGTIFNANQHQSILADGPLSHQLSIDRYIDQSDKNLLSVSFSSRVARYQNPNLGIFWRAWIGKCWYIV